MRIFITFCAWVMIMFFGFLCPYCLGLYLVFKRSSCKKIWILAISIVGIIIAMMINMKLLYC